MGNPTRPAQHIHYAPLHIKGITTSMPANGNAKKQARLEEVRKRRVEVKARKKLEREGGVKIGRTKGNEKGKGKGQSKAKNQAKNKSVDTKRGGKGPSKT
jgi:hypothetical protein